MPGGPATAAPRSLSLSKGGIRPLALMALTGFCLALYQPLFFLGTERNGVAVGTVVALGSAPILAGLLEWGLTRRVPSGTWMMATALATVGVVLLGFGGEAGGSRRDRPDRAGRERRRGSDVRRHRQCAAPAAGRGLGPVHRRRVDGRELSGAVGAGAPVRRPRLARHARRAS